MKIIRLEWLSEEGQEALLTLQAGSTEFTVFSHPCNSNVGEEVQSLIFSLDESNLVRIDSCNPAICQAQGKFESTIRAKVENTKKKIVSIGEVNIRLSRSLPGDIREGDYVSFTSLRLDFN
jgi:hypothetical protein